MKRRQRTALLLNDRTSALHFPAPPSGSGAADGSSGVYFTRLTPSRIHMLPCFIIQSDEVVFGDMLEFGIGHERSGSREKEPAPQKMTKYLKVCICISMWKQRTSIYPVVTVVSVFHSVAMMKAMK